MRSLRLQNKREIDSLAFGNIEPACAKIFPAVRHCWINFRREISRQDDKAGACLLHESLDIRWMKRRRRQPAPNAFGAAKIPDQTRLVVIERAEMHLRPQILARFSIQLPGRKKSRAERCDKKSEDKIKASARYGDGLEQGAASFSRRRRLGKRCSL